MKLHKNKPFILNKVFSFSEKKPFRFSLFFIVVFLFSLLLSCHKTVDDLPDAFILEKHYGGDSLDFAVQLLETDDGNYLILGNTASSGPGANNASLIKITPNGDEIWQFTYGGDAYDDAAQIVKLPDGSFFIVGSTLSFGHGGKDIMLIQVNSNGVQSHVYTFGDIYYDEGRFVSLSGDGHLLVGGYDTDPVSRDKNMSFRKISYDGQVVWKQSYGYDSTDMAVDMAVMSDGYLVVGRSFIRSQGHEDITLVKSDFDGNAIWMKTLGGENLDVMEDILAKKDGNFMLCGYSAMAYENENNDLYVIEIDGQGNILNENNFGDTDDWEFEEGYRIIGNSSGGYYVSGRKLSAMWILALDSRLNMQWEQTYGTVYNTYTMIGFDLKEEADGKIVIVGGEVNSISGKMVFLRLDPDKVVD